MKKFIGFAALALALAAPAVHAQGNDDGSWLVRLRATNLHSSNTDDTGLGLTINNKTFPEFDISYFYTPNFATELVLTYPQSQTVYSTVVGKGTAVDIGTFKHLPPTLLAQYHFTGITGFRPYLGVGVNYTNISAVNILNGAVGLKHSSYGLAAQAGFDVPLGGGWLINVDVKKVQIDTEVYLSGADKGKFKVDPVLASVGVGLRF